jgi:hypothetical protein
MVPVHGQGKTSDMRKDGSDFAQTREIGQNTWMGRMAQIGSNHGLFDRIGENHLTLFVDEGDTLIVAFDRAERARDIAADGLPAGFEMVRRRSWSLLSIMAEGDTWFLDAALTRFFRTLYSRGLFSRFSRVIFYGVGPDCGFAACAHARFAPGARILAAGPVATLDPTRAPFERRYRSARRLPFPGPMGFGPAGIATAEQALILHDPTEVAPAAHAALYAGRNVTRVALPYAGRDFSRILQEAEASIPVLRLLEQGAADTVSVRAALKEACRRNPGTMVRRARAALVQGRPERAAVIAEHGLAITGDKRLSALLKEARSGEPAGRI